MSKRECSFRKNDVKRAVQSAEMAGKTVKDIKIDQAGTITLVLDNGATTTAPVNEWDTAAE